MSDYLPAELISNILTRLPVDTLLRCTSVCKSWYSLITSPSFISSHLNKQEPRLLIRYATQGWVEDEHYCVHRDNQSFDEIAKLEFPSTKIIGVINGLVCLSEDVMKTIMLWNPSLRKSLILPKPKGVFDLDEQYRDCIGFGFLPTTNDYKIVRVSLFKLLNGSAKFPPIVEIYELSTGSWRNVNAYYFSYLTGIYAPQAFLNGVVHWPAFNFNRVGRTFLRLIVSFDMTSEKLGVLMVPDCLQNDDSILRVSTFRESLCLINSPFPYCSCSIWVMKEYGVADSWEELCNIDLDQCGLRLPLYLRENGDILSVKGGGALVSYDPIHNKVINVGQAENARSVVVDNYVESLVLINHSSCSKGKIFQYVRDVTKLDYQMTIEAESEEE